MRKNNQIYQDRSNIRIKISFCISIILHLFFLTGLPKLDFINLSNRRLHLDYKVYDTKDIKIVDTKDNFDKFVKDESLKFEEKEISKFLPPFSGDIFEKFAISTTNFGFEKPKILAEKIVEVNTVEAIDYNLKNLPKYMEYYWLIRSKISKIAHKLYDGKESGTVVLKFIVQQDGRLLNATVLKKSTSEVLDNLALKSIYDANPFPPFPQELKDYKTLPFNVSIHFKQN